MADPDTVEELLLQAVGEHRPSSPDISSILALIELGYDLDDDILPVVRRMVRHIKKPIGSWRYFVAEIKMRPLKASSDEKVDTSDIDGDFADGPRPVWWIRGDDPRYDALAARWQAEQTKRQKAKAPKPTPIMSKYFKGLGWAFPAHWVGDK